MHIHRIFAAAALVTVLGAAGTATAQPYTFTEIAREFAEGNALGFLDPSVTPALAGDGMVAFAGYAPPSLQSGPPQRILFGNGGAVTAIDLTGSGILSIDNIEMNARGFIVFEGRRTGPMGTYRGVYRTSTIAAGITTIYEGLESAMSPDPLPTSFSGNVALSESGLVAFSTITNGAGALFRGPVDGTPTVLREGNGTFFNNRALDVNDAGEVAMEMEYFDPTRGLARGVLVFSSPGQARDDLTTAMEKAGVGFRAPLAINASGQVAFIAQASATLTFYDPPDDASGTVVDVVNITPGVWLANPTAFGEPSDIVQIASDAVYGNFSKVDINADGTVVFQASPLAGGGTGIFKGNDPVADKIVQQGDVMGSMLFSIVEMGKLNDAGELSFYTSDFNSTDRQVWRVQGIQPPPPPAALTPLQRLLLFIIELILRLLGQVP